jgi:hypothetical protein
MNSETADSPSTIRASIINAEPGWQFVEFLNGKAAETFASFVEAKDKGEWLEMWADPVLAWRYEENEFGTEIDPITMQGRQSGSKAFTQAVVAPNGKVIAFGSGEFRSIGGFLEWAADQERKAA